MGKPFSHSEFMQNPNAAGGAGTGGYLGLEDFARSLGLGAAGQSAKSVLKQMTNGDYEGLAATLLSPIHDRYAANEREAERNAAMGANAMYAGTQPALMAGLQDTMRKQMAEGEGLAYGQAIPSLWSSAGGMFQNAKNAKEGEQLNALDEATRARLGSGSFQTQPGWMDRVGQVAGIVGQIAAPFTGGLSALAGLGRGGGLPNTSGASFSPSTMPSASEIGPPPGMDYSNPGGYNPGSFVPPLSGR